MRRALSILLPVALICAMTAACSGESSDSSTSSAAEILPSTTTTEQVSVFPGEYATSITVGDIRSGGAKDKSLAGDWVFTFTEVDAVTFDYVATLNGERAWDGTLTIDGDQASVTTEDVGPEARAAGTYTWSFDGNELTFVAVAEKSTNREVIFVTNPWVRQP